MNKTRHLMLARKVVNLMEMKFSFWKFKFGLDPLLGLIPGLGDLLSAAASFYIVFVALLHKVRPVKIIHMIFNIMVDLVVGSLPVLGDLLDFTIKPNIKNLAILEKEIKFSKNS